MHSTSTPPWTPDAGHVLGAAVTGADGHLIDVRARITNGPDSFTITGIRETSASTLPDRVRAAVLNAGLIWPGRAITADVTPPGLPACGLDLPVAVAVLTAAGVIPADTGSPQVFLADLGLDGTLRPVRGTIPAVTAAARAGVAVAVVAPGNAAEAVLVPGVSVVPCTSLRAVAAWLGAGQLLTQPVPGASRDVGNPRVAARLAASPGLLLALQASAAGITCR